MPSKERIFKLTVAAALFAGGAAYCSNQLFGTAAVYAMVAAPTFAVTAPVDGVVNHGARNFLVVEAGTSIATLTPVATNDSTIRAAKRDLEMARADVEQMKLVMETADQLSSSTYARYSVVEARRSSMLERALDQAKLEAATERAERDGIMLDQARSRESCELGLMPQNQCQDVDSKAQVAEHALKAAESRVELASYVLKSIKAGVDLGQNVASEAVFTRQRRDDLKLHLATLRKELKTREAQVRALAEIVTPEPVEVKLGSKARISTVARQSGALVGKGEPLLTAADCGGLFVYAVVSKRVYERLRVGTDARVTIRGQRLDGKVSELAGPFGSSVGLILPMPPPVNESTDNHVVAISVPKLSSVVGQTCEFGSIVKVTFVDAAPVLSVVML